MVSNFAHGIFETFIGQLLYFTQTELDSDFFWRNYFVLENFAIFSTIK